MKTITLSDTERSDLFNAIEVYTDTLDHAIDRNINNIQAKAKADPDYDLAGAIDDVASSQRILLSLRNILTQLKQ